jgi:hypothetical protein
LFGTIQVATASSRRNAALFGGGDWLKKDGNRRDLSGFPLDRQKMGNLIYFI